LPGSVHDRVALFAQELEEEKSRLIRAVRVLRSEIDSGLATAMC
jgi:uncharacterized membrane protein YqjE